LELYPTGQLTELPNKNCDTMTQTIPGTSEPQLQALLTNIQWDEQDRNRQRMKKMSADATLDDGMLVLDDAGFPKLREALVGMARQYAGALGKVGNDQIAVTCGNTDAQATWPIAVRLYPPQAWADDLARREKARVPDVVTFQTKPEIAVALLDQTWAGGVLHRCVMTDAGYGDTPHFLTALEAR
jgi:SRSO17 transposase